MTKTDRPKPIGPTYQALTLIKTPHGWKTRLLTISGNIVVAHQDSKINEPRYESCLSAGEQLATMNYLEVEDDK